MAAAPVLESTPIAAEPVPLRTAGRRRALNVLGPVGRGEPQVLVVEPDERTRALLNLGLSSEGFAVTAVPSAEEALAWLTPERPLPAMILSEAGLQSSDGFSFCSRVRADERTADIPVAILSRSPEAWERELAGAAGADQYLPKPLFLDDVVAIAKLMAGGSAQAATWHAETAQLSLFSVLRALLSGSRSGRIQLEDGAGMLGFRDGVVIEATWGRTSGVEALRRMLLLAEGAYTVTFGPLLTRSSMTFGLEELCGKFQVQLLRWRRLEKVALPLEATLEVDFARLVEELERLPDEVNALVRLFDGRRSVRDVVVDSVLDEVTTLEAATRLYLLGVITPPSVPEPTRPTAPAPEQVPDQAHAQPEPYRPPEPQVDLEPRASLEPQVDAEPRASPEPLPAPEPDPLPLVPPLVTRVLSPEEVPAPLAEFAGGQAPTADTNVVHAMATYASNDEPVDAEFLALSRRAYTRAWLASALIVAAAGIVAFVAWPRSVAPGPVAPPVVVVEAPAPVAEPVVPVAADSEPEPEPAVHPGFPLLQAIAHYDAGRLQQAVTALEAVTRDFPRSPQAWVYLGLAQFDLRQNRAAERSALKALELEPENGRALMLLATIYVDEGQREQANVQLKRYLELYPDGPFARDARQLLRR